MLNTMPYYILEEYLRIREMTWNYYHLALVKGYVVCSYAVKKCIGGFAHFLTFVHMMHMTCLYFSSFSWHVSTIIATVMIQYSIHVGFWEHQVQLLM